MVEFQEVPQILQLPNKIQKHHNTDVARRTYSGLSRCTRIG